MSARAENHNDRVLEYLKLCKSITLFDSLKYFGCSRLSSVICRLRKKGYNIKTVMEKKKGYEYARYVMGAK